MSLSYSLAIDEKRLQCAVRAYGARPRTFARLRALVYAHYHAYGRNLPWRHTRDPYHILVSEIMLQQTGVTRVAEIFPAFITRYPDWQALASTSTQDLLTAWRGMGYNRRALYLQRIAQSVITAHNGVLPRCPDLLGTFPGIGPATAASIAAFAFNIPTVFLETNIRTVLIHWFFPPCARVDDATLLPLAAGAVDMQHPRRWYNALMDYGTSLKARVANPSRRSTHHRPQSAFEGSRRQLRGRILRHLTTHRMSTVPQIAKAIDASAACTQEIVYELEKEGFLCVKEACVALR